jgi:hypothetical protein
MHTRLDELLSIRKEPVIIVGSDALAHNGLVSGYNINIVNTPYKTMNGVQVNGLVYEYFHLQDINNCNEVKHNLFVPTAERSLIDCMLWQEENKDEGFLIEALQTYQEQGHKASDLYECADHYLVPHEVVDYWWKEAEEDTEMSMG